MTIIALLMIMVTLAITCFASYNLGGAYGLAMAAFGLLSTHVFLSAISNFGGICDQTYRVGLFFRREIKPEILLLSQNISLVARNYCIFLPILNSSGIFIINVLCICFVSVIADNMSMTVWDS